MQSESLKSRVTAQQFAIALWIVQVFATLSMLIAAIIEIETIVITGPLLSFVGVLLGATTRRLRSWTTILFALSAPAVCALCALLIALFELQPKDARVPIPIVLAVYTLIALPLAIVAIARIRQWRIDASQTPRWQYSMKSLLAGMTAVCLATVAARSLFQGSPSPDRWIFAGFAVALIAICAVVLWRFAVQNAKTKDAHLH